MGTQKDRLNETSKLYVKSDEYAQRFYLSSPMINFIIKRFLLKPRDHFTVSVKPASTNERIFLKFDRLLNHNNRLHIVCY